jgi:hypothetical protein
MSGVKYPSDKQLREEGYLTDECDINIFTALKVYFIRGYLSPEAALRQVKCRSITGFNGNLLLLTGSPEVCWLNTFEKS